MHTPFRISRNPFSSNDGEILWPASGYHLAIGDHSEISNHLAAIIWLGLRVAVGTLSIGVERSTGAH
jgi:hypothetical protein